MTYRFVTSLDIDECHHWLNEAIDPTMGLYAVHTSKPSAAEDTFELKMAQYSGNGMTIHFFGKLRPHSTGTKIMGYMGLRGKIFADFWFFFILAGSLIAAWYGIKMQLLGVVLMAVLALVVNFYERRQVKQAFLHNQACVIDFLETTLEAMALEPMDLDAIEAEVVLH